MNFCPENVYHIYNQGNNHQTIFSCAEEYEIFLNLVRTNISAHCEIINWCLMPNHFHFLIYTDDRILNFRKQGGLELDVLTNGIRKLLSSYARIHNSKHGNSGSLFRQKTKSKCLSDTNFLFTPKQYNDSYFNCFHYIHQNPFVAQLVKRMEDWKFSSFRDYAGIRNGTLCNKFLAKKYCSYDPATFLQTSYQIIDNLDFFEV